MFSERDLLSAGHTRMGVVDSGYSRILMFDPYDQWPDLARHLAFGKGAFRPHHRYSAASVVPIPKASPANDGNPLASAGTLSGRLTGSGADTQRPGPQGAVLVNNELYVADTSNNRLIVLPLQNGNFGSATRVLRPGPV